MGASPEKSHAPFSASVADRLEAQRDMIARICERRIRGNLPSARAHSVPTVVDHIPQILDTMVDRLRGRSSPAQENAREKRVSRKHGTQRADLDSYTLENILSEYRLLRESLFEVLDRDGQIAAEERNAILDVLQLGAKYAAIQFLHERTVRANPVGHFPSSWPAKCCLSFGFVSVAAGIQWLLLPYLHGSPFICFYPAVVLSCLFGDGVVATILSALAAQLLFVPPAWSLKLNLPGDALQMLLFLFSAFLITIVTNMMRNSKRRADILAADQEKAMKEVEESEARFRELADSIPQMAWIADPTGAITWFNQRWYDFTGLKPEEMTTDFAWLPKVHDPVFLQKSHPRYEEHIRSGKAWEDTIPLKGRTGEWHWFLSRARPIRDAGGSIVRWFGTNTDITELRKARNEINEARERYELALTAGKIGVWEMDLKSPAIKWSPRQYEIFDVDPGTCPLTYEVFSRRIHSDDLDKVNLEFKASIEEKRDFHLTFRVLRRDGGTRWVRGDGRTYFGDGGEAVRMIGTNIDITDRVLADEAIRKSESEFRTLADSMPQIVWITDAAGGAEFFNRRFYNYTDLPFDEAKGAGWGKIVHPDDMPNVLAHWRRALENGTPFELEYRLRRNDGEYRWHLGRGVPVRDDHGRVVKWYGTNTEVHDYRLLISALEEEHRLRERFTSMLTHDLKNPLSAAKVSAQSALRRRCDHEGHEKAFLRIVSSVNRADKMIDDLLDANRIKAGEQLSLSVSSLDLRDLLSRVLEEQTLLHGNRFQLNVNDALPGYWSADALRRVFENLLGNAVKYGAGDTPITVSARETDSLVRVEVHNFGGELSPEESKNLFTMFRRARRAEASGKVGWGIGLTLVKGLVDAHGGRVWVKSGTGEGTSFFVELPRDSRPFVEAKEMEHGSKSGVA